MKQGRKSTHQSSRGPTLSAVVLAAGKSTRFPGTKQLARVAGKTLVERAIETARRAGIKDVVVVLGHDADSVVSAIRPRKGVRAVTNPRYASGMASSIKIGVQALPGESDGALILLADQPLVTPALLRRMITAFKKTRPREAIVAAEYDGLVAPPVIFSRDYFEELSGLRGDKGAKSLIQRHDSALSVVHAKSRAELTDVDTGADLAAAEESLLET